MGQRVVEAFRDLLIPTTPTPNPSTHPISGTTNLPLHSSCVRPTSSVCSRSMATIKLTSGWFRQDQRPQIASG